MQDALIKFIQAEVNAEQREVRNMHSLGVSSRVKRGECITGLNFQHVDADGCFIYSYIKNESKFRTGDLLVINHQKWQGEAVLNNGVLVWLDEINHSKRLIKLQRDQEQDPPRAKNCTVDKGFYDYNSERLKHSVELAYGTAEIVALMEGRAQLVKEDHVRTADVERYCREYPQLTPRQGQALASALSNDTTLIQGPPGSGKTFLLALIIEYAMASGKSVLVTAPTHKAIDHLLKAVAERLPQERPIVKIKAIGKPPRLPRKILQTTIDHPYLAELKSPFVIGLTVYQAYKLHQANILQFDLVVIDEAGQMPIVQAFPALINGSRYVIAGDHQQLAPIIKDPGAHPEFLKRSLFEHLHDAYSDATITLDVTYRMNNGINEFPSQAFYSNMLRPSQCAANRVFTRSPAAGRELDHIVCHGGDVTYVELEHRNAVQRAPEEADLVARLAQDLLVHHRVAPEDLAIVSPHRAHNETIRERLLLHTNDDDLMQSRVSERLVIDTVDRLQGQEREVIIFSLCASDREYAIGRAQFLYSPNRLNVAITRSRTRLFLVGSKYFFPHLNGILIDARYLALWESYYEYLVKTGCRVIHSHYNQLSMLPNSPR